MSSSVSALFRSIRVGTTHLHHRVTMAPLTRLRANKDHTTGAIHANGSYIFLQLWAIGRAAGPAILRQEGGFLVSPSHIPFGSGEPHSGNGELVVPRELTTAGIKECAQLYSKAASNAIEAGFDGVELLQTMSSERTDEYGGFVDNRVRFPLEPEVIDAVVETIGAERTAVSISPWSKY
ncbi:hypothetical protein EDB89DRAFT_1900271 [Lactarius sanguifluus]|nr:hypothetical protein EDB89DRAFT_1900271 [Lactarius sanguifluus]